MILLSFLASFLSLSSVAAASEKAQQSQPSWHKFGSNVNYRITAILDVNGGAGKGPNFESVTSADGGLLQDDASTKSTKTPGYSIPIDVLMLQDGDNNYRQRVSYYSGTQVEYNNNGEGFKVISTPYTGGESSDTKASTCFLTGGSSTDVTKQVGYLNFFPTVEQMEHYTFGNLITTEPGIPYRVATLQAPHGSFNATSKMSQPDASYDAHPGMPSDDWFQLHYQESLFSSGLADKATVAARPLKWTMLARNQIINAHTENWVLRYLSYEAIDKDEERKLWENWFDSSFHGDCGDGNDQFTLADDSSHNLQLNRLGMFFSASSHSLRDVATDDALSAASPANPSHFDFFLARHNRHYPHAHEYSKRKAIHDTNTKNIERWNQEHAGKTMFAPNEFLDLEVKEVMKIRGGHIPRSKSKIGRRVNLGHDNENKRHLRSTISDNDQDPHFLLGDAEEHTFTHYQLPKDFDPSTFPESFDWRDHLPGSVNAIKDQGFCGSCWAFSFVSALESHWYIANGQSVDLPEQFVNDCAWSDSAHACDGGNSGPAAIDIIDKFQGKVPTRDAYGGYLSVDGGCYVDILQDMGLMDDNELLSTSSSAVQLTDWVVLPTRDDIATKHALYTKGPLSIALNVVPEALYYANGVLDVASCSKNGAENLDHAINVVGWGVDELPDGSTAEHWVLRNSWSDLWGDSGYFKVRMGDRDCGVTTSAGYPVVPKLGTPNHGLVEALEKVATS
mmetsp:Transcript_4629/g.8222  ORF Transcript_4629/g.8222 Transcript_4629/m.8222 type:complete len:733 (-) Transcript_4629:125-2323(-)|eukprot:CAMPEP_0201882908 /NCGR_PEP_ID=MMETSP0902-20130614/14858_1 /ASSEMBLY_ACC=CAM_ASM_000551 /TAXON_ID=420261 /ORGANISM="Thalassiosira antarctica, Strain CCMP982" /LENGTH=732 /DNA_ID=CAMNT_0048411563 /DNA_START=101 /DNA_END=2299 /DNA_ORIENTATION=+